MTRRPHPINDVGPETECLRATPIGRQSGPFSKELVIHLTQVRPERPLYVVVAFRLAAPAASRWAATGVPNQGPIRNGIDLDGLLGEAEEQQAAVARPAPIEPERELVQVVIQMRRADRTLLRPQQPTFEQGHHEVYPGNSSLAAVRDGRSGR